VADVRREERTDLGEPVPADLMLGPATRLLWRAPDSLHLELGSAEVVVDGLPAPVVRRFASPVPPADPPPALDAAARHALVALTEAGYLWPRPREADDPRFAPPDPRLAGELAALAVRHGEDAAQVLSARRHTTVEVRGAGRLAPHLAALLAAAGVRRVHCAVDGVTKLRHAMPGGVRVEDEGVALATAVEEAIRRAAPEADTTPLPVGERADLTVLALDGPVPAERAGSLHAADAPYLAVSLGLDHGVVGPLVLPGDRLPALRRAAPPRPRPAWPALAVQLTVERRHGPASEVALATVIAGVAAQQALTFLDGGEPACLDGTLELRLPDWRLRRRSWPAHAECGCCAADPAE
jgi:hypothetical protein